VLLEITRGLTRTKTEDFVNLSLNQKFRIIVEALSTFAEATDEDNAAIFQRSIDELGDDAALFFTIESMHTREDIVGPKWAPEAGQYPSRPSWRVQFLAPRPHPRNWITGVLTVSKRPALPAGTSRARGCVVLAWTEQEKVETVGVHSASAVRQLSGWKRLP